MPGIPPSVRIGVCQLPEIREDIETALTLMENRARKAQTDAIDLLCFPECFLQGYLTERGPAQRHAIALESPAFQLVLHRLEALEPTLAFGLIESYHGQLYNTAVVVSHGRLLGRYRKVHLLEGERIFTAGAARPIFELKKLKFGLMICSDANFAASYTSLVHQGAKLALCLANNMMPRDVAEKWKHRHNTVRCQHTKAAGLWLLSSDVTSQHGDHISYGPTAVISPDGQVIKQVPLHEEGMVSAEV